MILYICLGLISYLLGSISSAVWISRRFYGIDIREHGSGNAGATNMLRVLGRKAALPVFIIDFFKGYVAVAIAHFTDLDGDSFFILKLVLAFLAVVGHMFPLYTKFKGGKGVATIAGAMLGIAPLALLLAFTTFFVTLAISKYVSLGSMIGGISFPIYILLLEGNCSLRFYFGITIALLLILTHRKNIGRIAKGTESKIYLKKRKEK